MMDDVSKTCSLCSNVFLSAGAGSVAAMFYYQWQLSGDVPRFFTPLHCCYATRQRRTRTSQGKCLLWTLQLLWKYVVHLCCIPHKSTTWSHWIHSIMESVNIFSIYMNFNAVGNGKSLSVSMIWKFSSLTGWNTLDEFWSNCRTLV